MIRHDYDQQKIPVENNFLQAEISRLVSAVNPKAAIKMAFAGVGNPLKFFTCSGSRLNFASLNAEKTATRKAAVQNHRFSESGIHIVKISAGRALDIRKQHKPVKDHGWGYSKTYHIGQRIKLFSKFRNAVQ